MSRSTPHRWAAPRLRYDCRHLSRICSFSPCRRGSKQLTRNLTLTSISRADIEALHALRSRLTETRLTDRGRIGRELDRLFSRRERGDFDSAVATLSASIEKSIAKVESLRGLPLKLNYEPELPITAHRDEVLSAL